MDTYFGKNKFVGPPTITKQCGRGGKGIRVINTLELSDQSQIKITVECSHGQRQVRWNRRFQPCKRCAAEAGVYNTCPKGRIIAWGDKISDAKKGRKFSEEHKKALVEIRKKKFCQRTNTPEHEFNGFPSYGEGRWNLSYVLRQGIIHNWQLDKIEFDETTKLIFEVIGYSLLDLKVHLESLFKEGMSWKNYGYYGWHVDHIKPLSWFQISSIRSPDFKECWALENLQPLWMAQNLKKSNHYMG